jgi:hypothetical protein
MFRLAMGKPPATTFPPGCKTGKMTAEKVTQVKDAWVRHIDSKFPGKSISGLVGYTFMAKADEGGEEDEAHRD